MTSKIIKSTLNPLVQSWNKLIFLSAKKCKCLDESTCDEVPTGPALIFGDGTSCRSRGIRIWWGSRGRALCLTGSLGRGWDFRKKEKISLILNQSPSLVNRSLQGERRVQVLPSSPPVKNLSVDDNRGDGGPLPALLLVRIVLTKIHF